MSENWLQNYFLNRQKTSDYIDSNNWMNERSQFERSPQSQLSSGTYLKKTANISIVSRDQIQQILQMQNAEGVFANLARRYNGREIDFAIDVDFPTVLRFRLEGCPWVEAYSKYLNPQGPAISFQSTQLPQAEPAGFEVETEQPLQLTASKKKS